MKMHEGEFGPEGPIKFTATPRRTPASLFADMESAAAAAARAAAPSYVIEQQEADQKTRDWFISRMGFFNASDMPNLMKQGRGKGELWGATAMGVIEKVIVERSMTDEGVELYVSELMAKEFRPTNWGNKYEPEARAAVSAALGVEIIEVGSNIHPDIPYFRGSADGLTVPAAIPGEYKCPYDPMKHQSNLRLMRDGLTEKHEYYAQIQSHMMIHSADKCYFASYDPRRTKTDQLALIEVPRDEVYIAALRARLEEAEAMVNEYLLTEKN